MSTPGRTGCRTRYNREETTMDTSTLRPEVATARQEVQEAVDPDFLGLRQKQWTTSAEVPRTKYKRDSSDQRLTNTLNPQQLTATGTLLTVAAGFQHDPVTYHAFDRGEVTTGWNFSTAVSPKDKAACLLALNATAKAQTARAGQSLRRYSSPMQRQSESMEAMRYLIATAGHEDRELEARWGKEVATELKYIESLQQPKSRIRIRATQTDLSAVLALPGDGSDDEA